MKKLKKAFIFLFLALLLTSCGLDNNKAAPEENSPDARLTANSDWRAIPGVSTNYVQLENVNRSAVPEIELKGSAGSIFRETAEGLLCANTLSVEISKDQETKKIPHICKLDREGRVIWEKEYDYPTYSGSVNNLAVFPDGGFVFAVRTYPTYPRGLLEEKSCLIRCDQDGQEIWRQAFDDYGGDLLRHLFITENDEVIAVGQWRSKNGRQTKEEVANSLVVTKLDQDGRLLRQKNLGGSDFDNINTATYHRSLGIVVNGRTQSGDGDFAIGQDRRSADFIACINENLDVQWVVHAREKENFVYDQLALSQGFVYVLGNYAREGAAPIEGFLVKLDNRGHRVWTKTGLHPGLWGRVVALLSNGDIAVGAGQRNQGCILILAEDGMEKKKLEDLKFAVDRITPTADGGFITTSLREIKTVPQPPVISSIWYDTELVAVKYTRDYTLQWRKTYDNHKDEHGFDFAFPLESGRLIVEDSTPQKTIEQQESREGDLPKLVEQGTVTFRSREGEPEIKLPLFGIAATYGVDFAPGAAPAAVPPGPLPEISFAIPVDQQDQLAVFWVNLDLSGEDKRGILLMGPRGWRPLRAGVGANGTVGISLENPEDPREHLTYFDTSGGNQGMAIAEIGAYFPSLRQWAEEQAFPGKEMKFSRQILLSPRIMAYAKEHIAPGYETNGVAYQQREESAWFRREEVSHAASKRPLITTILNFFVKQYN